jgi:hypothetical protein
MFGIIFPAKNENTNGFGKLKSPEKSGKSLMSRDYEDCSLCSYRWEVQAFPMKIIKQM